MDVHEAAEIFPLEEETLPELAKDLRRNGQVVPIDLLDGKILDGRRRWRACALAGITPKTREVQVSDPVAYVLSTNLHRRQLTISQRAMVAARSRAIYDRQARERMAERKGDQPGATVASLPHLDTGKARDAAGKALGVSGKSVDHATKVLAKGVPELVAAVDQGRMAVSTAAVLAHEPEEEQREQVSKKPRTYTSKSGGGKDVMPRRHAVVKGVVYDGFRYADMAIEQLKRIEREDPNRAGALDRVQTWINRNR